MALLNEVNTYKGEVAGFFAFFQTDREDAYNLIHLLEDVDGEYTGFLSVQSFAERYCAQCKIPFLALYHYYMVAFKVIENRRSDMTSAEQFGSQAKQAAQNSMNTQLESMSAHISYVQALGFLYLICSVPEVRVMEFLFWMAFAAQQKAVTQDELLTLYDKLYSDQIDNQNRMVLSNRDKLVNLCKQVDMDSVTAYRLQLFDIRAGGMYAKALSLVRRTLVSKLLGKKFWLRIAEQFHKTTQDLEESYLRFERIPYHHPPPSHASSLPYILRGERKNSRKELRRYVRLLLDFKRVETAEREERSKSGKEKNRGFFSKVLRSLPSSTSNTSQNNKSSSFWSKVFPTKSDAAADSYASSNPVCDDTHRQSLSLEERYPEALTLPLTGEGGILGGVKQLVKEAKAGMRECKEVLDASKAGWGKSGKSGKGNWKGSVKPQVPEVSEEPIEHRSREWPDDVGDEEEDMVKKEKGDADNIDRNEEVPGRPETGESGWTDEGEGEFDRDIVEEENVGEMDSFKVREWGEDGEDSEENILR
ncbi:hypothetical protein EON65_06215 [archaeon]|nr:MAG: hypothetical protein EON65_06215 [archaeon]